MIICTRIALCITLSISCQFIKVFAFDISRKTAIQRKSEISSKFNDLKSNGYHLMRSRRLSSNTFSLKSVPQLSLDISAVPSARASPLGVSTVLLALVVLVTYAMTSIISSMSITLPQDNRIVDWLTCEVIPGWKLGFRVFTAKLGLFTDRIAETLSQIFSSKKSFAVDLSEWNVCVLSEKEYLPGNYLRYRMTLPNSASTVPLFAGQELLLCMTDDQEEVIKEAFHPFTSTKSKGFFDILVRKDVDVTSEDERFIQLLEGISIGDELAFKGGEYKLKFGGMLGDEVKGITIIGSSLGIAPALQILRGVLAMDDITVEDVEFIWLNEDRKDFVLEKEIEILELQYFDKFSTTKVLEKGLFGKDLGRNSIIEDSTKPFSAGRIGIVCAPDYHTALITQFLVTSKRYPVQYIAVIDTQI